jgi:hypothetical protein
MRSGLDKYLPFTRQIADETAAIDDASTGLARSVKKHSRGQYEAFIQAIYQGPGSPIDWAHKYKKPMGQSSPAYPDVGASPHVSTP